VRTRQLSTQGQVQRAAQGQPRPNRITQIAAAALALLQLEYDRTI
jgi:hypothetical protein